MRLTPKTEEEIQEAGLMPEGCYDFEVIHAEEGTSKKGNEMIIIELAVFDATGRRREIKDYLMEAMAFKLRHFCETAGIIDDYNAGILDADNLTGKTGKVTIGKEPAKGNFRAKNTVVDYGENHSDPKPDVVSHPRPTTGVSTEVPAGDDGPF
jgi:Protein of unknown function (DUF669)